MAAQAVNVGSIGSIWTENRRKSAEQRWLGGCCSAGPGSRCIPGPPVNAGERVDPFGVALGAARNGDFDAAEPIARS